MLFPNVVAIILDSTVEQGRDSRYWCAYTKHTRTPAYTHTHTRTPGGWKYEAGYHKLLAFSGMHAMSDDSCYTNKCPSSSKMAFVV